MPPPTLLVAVWDVLLPLLLVLLPFAWCAVATPPPAIDFKLTVRDFMQAACVDSAELSAIWPTASSKKTNFNDCPVGNESSYSGHPDFQTFGYGVGCSGKSYLDLVSSVYDGTVCKRTDSSSLANMTRITEPVVEYYEDGLPKPPYCKNGGNYSVSWKTGTMASSSRCGWNDGAVVTTSGKSYFDAWYRDNAKYSKRVAVTIQVPHISGGIYSYTNDFFTPFEMFNIPSCTASGGLINCSGGEKVWPKSILCTASDCSSTWNESNTAGGKARFGFTTEHHSFFQFKGTETFEFIGDDDLWVYINDRIAVDVGGIHAASVSKIDLSNSYVQAQLGLVLGQYYGLDIFHAERHTAQSNYKITTSLRPGCNIVDSGSYDLNWTTNAVVDETQWKFVGGPTWGKTVSNGTAIRLVTKNETDTVGFAYLKSTFNVEAGFLCTFTFTAGAKGSGFTFNLRRDGIVGLEGTATESLGFDKANGSLAIAFDFCADRANTSAGCLSRELRVHFIPGGPGSGALNDAVVGSPTKQRRAILIHPNELNDGVRHTVEIKYYGRKPNWLEVFIDGDLFLQHRALDLETVLGGASAWAGFTASTGVNLNQSSTIDIETFSFQTVAPSFGLSQPLGWPPPNANLSVARDGSSKIVVEVITYDSCFDAMTHGGYASLARGLLLHNDYIGSFPNNITLNDAVEATIMDIGNGTYRYEFIISGRAGIATLHAWFGAGCFDNGNNTGLILVTGSPTPTCFYDNRANVVDFGSASPTVSPTKQPTRSPTASPTYSPTRSPTAQWLFVTPPASTPLSLVVPLDYQGAPLAMQLAVLMSSPTNENSFNVVLGCNAYPSPPQWLSLTFVDQSSPLQVPMEVETIVPFSLLVSTATTGIDVSSTYLSSSLPNLTTCFTLNATDSVSIRVIEYFVSITVYVPCLPGSFSSTGNNLLGPCILCPALGTYQPMSAQTSCIECPDTTPFTSSPGATSCYPCPLGNYCPLFSLPFPCPPGGYESSNASTSTPQHRNATGCQNLPCASDFFCGPGTVENTTYIRTIATSSLLNINVDSRSTKLASWTITNLHPRYTFHFNISDVPSWISRLSPSEGIVTSNSTITLTLTFDSNKLLDGSVIYVASNLSLNWWIPSIPNYPLQSHVVDTSMNIIPVLVSPTILTYTLDLGTTQPASDTSRFFEIFNGLCTSSLTYSIYDGCDGHETLRATDLGGWFFFITSDPYSTHVMLSDKRLPDVITFGINLNSPQVASFVGPASLNSTTLHFCFTFNISLEYLPVLYFKPVDVFVEVKQRCPKGHYSSTGDNSGAGCSPCAAGSYQPEIGQTTCIPCTETFPVTLSKGSISQKACTVSSRFVLGANNTRFACPTGTNCTLPGTTLENLPILPGFWRTSRTSINVLPCPNIYYCVGTEESSRGRRQLDDIIINNSTLGCAENHFGVFCSSCLPGSAKRGNHRMCEVCTDGNRAEDVARVAGTSVAILVLFFAIYSIVVLRLKRYLERTQENLWGWVDSVAVKLKVLIGFLQIVTAIGLNFTPVLPREFLDIAQAFKVFSIVLVDFIDFGCTITYNSFYVNLLISTLLPALFIVLIILIYFFVTRYFPDHLDTTTANSHEKDFQANFERFSWAVILFLLFVIYPGVSSVILSTFNCRGFDDGSFALKADYSVQCYTNEHRSFMIYAGFCVLLYILGVPYLFGYLLYKERHGIKSLYQRQNLRLLRREKMDAEREPSTQYIKFLWKSYVPSMYMYEVFELVRKLFQTAVVGFIGETPGNAQQMVAQISFTLLVLIVLYVLRPYDQAEDTRFALIAQWSLFVISFLSLLTKLEVGSDGEAKLDVGVISALLTTAVLVNLIIGLLIAATEMVRSNAVSSIVWLMKDIMKIFLSENFVEGPLSTVCWYLFLPITVLVGGIITVVKTSSDYLHVRWLNERQMDKMWDSILRVVFCRAREEGETTMRIAPPRESDAMVDVTDHELRAMFAFILRSQKLMRGRNAVQSAMESFDAGKVVVVVSGQQA